MILLLICCPAGPSASPLLSPPFSLHANPCCPANRAVMAGFPSSGAGLAVSASARVLNIHPTANCKRSDTSKLSLRPTGTLRFQVSIHPCASDFIVPSPCGCCPLHLCPSQNVSPLPRTARQAILRHSSRHMLLSILKGACSLVSIVRDKMLTNTSPSRWVAAKPNRYEYARLAQRCPSTPKRRQWKWRLQSICRSYVLHAELDHLRL